MAESPDLSDVVRRTMEANARLYQGWVDLSVEYFRGISEIFSGVQGAVDAAAGSSPTSSESHPVAGAVVMEGEQGETAGGAFLVTNDLGRPLKCEIEASRFSAAGGAEAPARIEFEPASFELEPGEQQVVRATVPIDPELVAGAAYTGTFGIKGLEGFSVPAVLRRHHPVDRSPIDRVADEEPVDEAAGPATKKNAAASTKATGGTSTAKKSTAKKSTTKKSTTKKSTAKKSPAKKKSPGRKSSS